MASTLGSAGKALHRWLQGWRLEEGPPGQGLGWSGAVPRGFAAGEDVWGLVGMCPVRRPLPLVWWPGGQSGRCGFELRFDLKPGRGDPISLTLVLRWGMGLGWGGQVPGLEALQCPVPEATRTAFIASL